MSVEMMRSDTKLVSGRHCRSARLTLFCLKLLAIGMGRNDTSPIEQVDKNAPWAFPLSYRWGRWHDHRTSLLVKRTFILGIRSTYCGGCGICEGYTYIATQVNIQSQQSLLIPPEHTWIDRRVAASLPWEFLIARVVDGRWVRSDYFFLRCSHCARAIQVPPFKFPLNSEHWPAVRWQCRGNIQRCVQRSANSTTHAVMKVGDFPKDFSLSIY